MIEPGSGLGEEEKSPADPGAKAAEKKAQMAASAMPIAAR
jgi:hypothetical protein